MIPEQDLANGTYLLGGQIPLYAQLDRHVQQPLPGRPTPLYLAARVSLAAVVLRAVLCSPATGVMSSICGRAAVSIGRYSEKRDWCWVDS